MGFRFLAVVYLPGEYPDAGAARRTARQIHGETMKRVTSDVSDDVAIDEDNARRRTRGLRFRDTGEGE